MTDADAPVTCPHGHVGATRLLPVFATTGLAAEPRVACGAPVEVGCGGGCVCC